MILLPLIVGFIIKARAPSVARWLVPVLERVSGIALPVTDVLIISLGLRSLLGVLGTGAIYAGILFSFLTALARWLSGDRDPARRMSLGLATGFRNFPAALIVSVQNFEDPNVTMIVIVTTLTELIGLFPVALLLGKRNPVAPGKRDWNSVSDRSVNLNQKSILP